MIISSDNEVSSVEVGQRVRQLRGNMSQKEFADMLGVSRSFVSNLEQGITKPSVDVLLAISQQCHVSTDWILTGKQPADSQVVSMMDAELRHMVDFLEYMWVGADRDMQGWIKIQFQSAFSAFIGWRQKKEPSAAGEGTPNGA